MTAFLLVLASYVMGATPSSYLVGRIFHGVDLREVGSGNLGATNTFRALGWKAAAPVMVVDVAKGWIPAALFPALLVQEAGAMGVWPLVFGGTAVLGHAFSFWVGFRGGKGVATSTGVFLALAPWAVGVGLLIWLGVLATTRIVSAASLAAAASLPVSVALLEPGRPGLLAFTVGLAAFVVWAHRTNVQRLLRDEEPRISPPQREKLP
ncbi:MAG: glycerol-3-phosphate 1-O-acyltransferase PlsY [Gemmatimonadota bacterium]